MPFIPYQEDGNWEPYLPKYEPQAEFYETNGCTVWGTQNQLETFYKRLYSKEPNYSERFTYLLTPIDPAKGSDPQKVYECIRRDGLVDNDLLPVPNTKQEFLDLSRVTGSLRAKGINWLRYHEIQHEWVWRGAPPQNALDLMKTAIKSSPLAISVSAWFMGPDGKYIDNGFPNNHWCMCYRIDDEGIHVFDSYDHSTKVLAQNHHISSAKRIWLNELKKPALRKQKTLLELILSKLLMKPDDLLDVVDVWLGKDASPSDLAPDELGCAETVTTLMRRVWPNTPILINTWALYTYFKHPENGWIKVTEPEAGDIVISPTGLGYAGRHGHCGIVLNGGVIASNDSGIYVPANKGKFVKNYDLQSWKARYGGWGFPTMFWRHK
jgi:hypothetical protein